MLDSKQLWLVVGVLVFSIFLVYLATILKKSPAMKKVVVKQDGKVGVIPTADESKYDYSDPMASDVPNGVSLSVSLIHN